MPETTPFLVRQLNVEGNTVFDSATLQALLAPLQDKRLTLLQIAEGIEAITTYYRAAGYPLARTIIPAQTIEDGVLRVQVIEANWGQVELSNNSVVQDAVLLRPLSNLEPGNVIRLDGLVRATLLLSDLPGVSAGGPVLDPVGLLGRLVRLTPSPAIVQLLTDRGSRVGV